MPERRQTCKTRVTPVARIYYSNGEGKLTHTHTRDWPHLAAHFVRVLAFVVSKHFLIVANVDGKLQLYTIIIIIAIIRSNNSFGRGRIKNTIRFYVATRLTFARILGFFHTRRRTIVSMNFAIKTRELKKRRRDDHRAERSADRGIPILPFEKHSTRLNSTQIDVSASTVAARMPPILTIARRTRYMWDLFNFRKKKREKTTNTRWISLAYSVLLQWAPLICRFAGNGICSYFHRARLLSKHYIHAAIPCAFFYLFIMFTRDILWTFFTVL